MGMKTAGLPGIVEIYSFSYKYVFEHLLFARDCSKSCGVFYSVNETDDISTLNETLKV